MLGAYGGRQCGTPALDQFAEQASILEWHYTPSPLCGPAHASMLTGLYPRQHGMLTNGWFKEERENAVVDEQVTLLTHRLMDVGYQLAHVGGQPARTKVDFKTLHPGAILRGPGTSADHLRQLESKGLHLGDRGYFRTPVVEFNHGEPVVFPEYGTKVAVFPLREEHHYDSVLTDKAIDILEHHDKRKPLAMFVKLALPQPPLWAPEPWATMYHPDEVKLAPTVGRWFSSTSASHLFNPTGHLGAHVTEEQWRVVWSMYMGMVGLMDKCIGRLIDALQINRLYDNSMIVFTADHGEMLGCRSLFQNGCMYEDAVRVPGLIKMPGRSSMHRVRTMTTHLDLPVTMLDVAGAEPFEKTSGASLINLTGGETATEDVNPYVFAAYEGNAGLGYHQRMVRSRTHKLIHNVGGKPELYDLISDPFETRSLIGKEEHQDIERRMRGLVNDWMSRMGDDQEKV